MSPQVFIAVYFDHTFIHILVPSHIILIHRVLVCLCLNLFAKHIFHFIGSASFLFHFFVTINFEFLVYILYLTFKMLTEYVYEQSLFVATNNGFDSLSGMSWLFFPNLDLWFFHFFLYSEEWDQNDINFRGLIYCLKQCNFDWTVTIEFIFRCRYVMISWQHLQGKFKSFCQLIISFWVSSKCS